MGFYNYLRNTSLYYERLSLNKQLIASGTQTINNADNMLLENAFLYMKINMEDSVLSCLKKISFSSSFDSTKLGIYTSMLMVNKQFTLTEKILNQERPRIGQIYYNDAITCIKILSGGLEKDKTKLVLSEPINEITLRYKNFTPRSPALAGIYSAIIPGAGKLYLGYKNQAITACIVNILLAAQATESYIKKGPSSTRFIISSGIFGVFYVGNIWGSVVVAKKRKKNYYQQTEYEIHNIYSSYIYQHAR